MLSEGLTSTAPTAKATAAAVKDSLAQGQQVVADAVNRTATREPRPTCADITNALPVLAGLSIDLSKAQQFALAGTVSSGALSAGPASVTLNLVRPPASMLTLVRVVEPALGRAPILISRISPSRPMNTCVGTPISR